MRVSQYLFAGLVSFAVVSCAGMPEKPYPTDWPTLRANGSANCNDLTGIYLNRAAKATLFQSPSYPQSADAFLTSLLRDGTEGTFDPESMRVSFAELELTHNALKVFDRTQNATLKNPLPSKLSSSSCTAEHGFYIGFQAQAHGESLLTGQRTINLELRVTSTNELVVHQIVRMCGIHFPVVPGCHESENWYLFRRKKGTERGTRTRNGGKKGDWPCLENPDLNRSQPCGLFEHRLELVGRTVTDTGM